MSRRILLVDDNACVLATVGQTLRDAGYLVTSTNSGADAVCLLGAKPPPDLVILDLLMPGFGGRDVLAALGPTAPPVVVMTGADPGACEMDLSHVARVLPKPFGPEALLAAVADALVPPPERQP